MQKYALKPNLKSNFKSRDSYDWKRLDWALKANSYLAICTSPLLYAEMGTGSLKMLFYKEAKVILPCFYVIHQEDENLFFAQFSPCQNTNGMRINLTFASLHHSKKRSVNICEFAIKWEWRIISNHSSFHCTQCDSCT